MVPIVVLCLVLAGFAVYLRAGTVRSQKDAQTEIVHLRDAGVKLAKEAANYRIKLNAMSQSSAAGILMLDERGTVVHSNSTANNILGRTDDSMIGKALAEVTSSEDLRRFAIEASVAGRPQARDVELKSAPSRILRVAAYPFERGLSGLPETMLVLTDVTDRRRLENVRREFVANVSHELRTPLASIRAIAETLQDGALHDPQVAQRFLNTIVKEADRLTRTSNDLLILSDVESKQPDRAPFDFSTLLREVVEKQRPLAEGSGLDLSLDAQPGLEMQASRDQIEQVVANLVNNAIRYTPKGRVAVRASIDDDGWTVLAVVDTGIGIKPVDQPHIFDRFYRVDRIRSRKGGGTGLGLSIVRKIVESHGGEVRIQSEFGHGSTFICRFPPRERP